MSETEKPTCATCPHWTSVKALHQDDAGVCHRFPQTVSKAARSWCAEHPARSGESDSPKPGGEGRQTLGLGACAPGKRKDR